MICTPHRGSSCVRIYHVIHACSERFSSTLSPPFHPTSFSSHSLSSISCTSYCTSSTICEGSSNTAYSAKKEMESYDESYLLTGYEPKNYDFKETCVESLTESLTQPQFSEQRFLEDVDYDDTRSRKCFTTHTEYMSITPSESRRRRPCPNER